MLNQNHNVHKRTNSKILLIVICIFGLLFSYSCSCKNNVTGPGNDGLEDGKEKITNVDPTVFSISTSSVETRLVQKADGSGFNYQPSIKFIEANGNQFTVSYEVTDNDTANKIEKANITYNEKDGLITFDKTAVLDKLATSKKSITITFTVKANDTTLQNPETNFTLNVDLKKTYGKLDPAKNIGELFVQASGFSPSSFGFTVQFRNAKTTDVSATLSAIDQGKDKGKLEYNKNNFITSLKN